MANRVLGVLMVVGLGAVVGVFGKASDPGTLAAVGQVVGRKVHAALPDRSRLSGPLTAVRPTDLFPVEEQVRARIKSDKLMQGATVDVATGDRPGEVRLRGTVPTEAHLARATQLAGETVGVGKVVNELVLAGE